MHLTMRKLAAILICFVIAICAGCKKETTPTPAKTEIKDPFPIPQDALRVNISGKHGGSLVSAILSEVKSFNTLLFNDDTGQMLNQLMNPGLTVLNLITQEPEPALAKSWEKSADSLSWTFHLRQGVKWSDGQPFNADDVIFTMQLVNDPNMKSGAQDALLGGKIAWTKLDDYTVQAKLPEVLVSFLRALDGPTVPVIPKHRWESVYKEGKFKEAMQVSMDPKDYVTLGAFTLKSYNPGQNFTIHRNPHYWKVDNTGHRLPYLNEITFLMLPNQDQIFLKVESGEIDTFYSVRPEDLDRLQQKASAIDMKVIKVGPSFDSEFMWFNMNGDKNPKTRKPYVDPIKRAWFTDLNFRRAVSTAINRDHIVQNVYFGRALPAWGAESTVNKLWYNDKITRYPYNPEKALELLKASGFYQKQDSLGKTKLYDRKGNEVRFSLNTNSESKLRGMGCNFIASDLSRLGMQAEVTILDFNAIQNKILSQFDYDAILLGLSHNDIDPTEGSNIWFSNGTVHFWWPEEKTPATDWEKRIDELMQLQQNEPEYSIRKKYYDEVQQIVSDQVPVIYTVNQFIYACAKNKIGNLRPTVARHRTLWNADELYWQ
jgi:peptide/nickel transport system substrate-binding protein